MAKKAEEAATKEVTEKEVQAEVKETPKVEFRTVKGKNFVGFVHPSTRAFVSVDKDGKILVDPSDEKALEILRSAADVAEI
ncbi:hypothetical protein P7D95_05495 [Enterococcus avium]|uniref:hypothetical protein n=1 Tax=Enterococcus avium TaxID=33945 RepID=UPI0028923170|nr:hypothetical protein [Enterococcus avium]MDT2500249.1 hypothetical protein [Enterococcus avium]